MQNVEKTCTKKITIQNNTRNIIATTTKSLKNINISTNSLIIILYIAYIYIYIKEWFRYIICTTPTQKALKEKCRTGK